MRCVGLVAVTYIHTYIYIHARSRDGATHSSDTLLQLSFSLLDGNSEQGPVGVHDSRAAV